jgi:hypothetical protein
MDVRELAWAAGLFEGEGCIAVNVSPHHHGVQPIATLTMTDEDSVQRFVAAIGMGSVRSYPAKGSRKAIYCWRVGSLEGVQQVLCLLWFGLGTRRRQRAREVMRAVVEDRARPRAPRKRPTHCKNGHEFTPENTYVWSRDGSRQCKSCAYARKRLRRMAIAAS